MDYKLLSEELFNKFHEISKCNDKKNIFDDETRGEGFIIHLLNKAEKKVVPSEISAIMGVSTPRVAAVLNNLEKKGYITREIEKADRRKILVGLTDKGKKFAHEQAEKMYKKFYSLLEALGEDDAKELIRILEKIIKLRGE